MPRRRVADRREILPDPVYNSPLVTKFISGIMWDGKKSVAEGIFYRALQQMGDKTGEALLQRLKHGPDAKVIVREAIREAARNAAGEVTFEGGSAYLEA